MSDPTKTGLSKPKAEWFKGKAVREDEQKRGPLLSEAPAPFQVLVQGLSKKVDVGFNHLDRDGIWQVFLRVMHSSCVASYVDGDQCFVVVESYLGLKDRWELDEVDDLVEAMCVDEEHRKQADDASFAALNDGIDDSEEMLGID